MVRTRVVTCALGLFALAGREALAEGSDHPKEVLAMQGPNCVHGYYVNWADTFFFVGDTAAFNKFVEGYGKRFD